ncbi:MAG TPA: SEC-C domain-containing protein [Mucilaginibacter sp.]|jgi:hypothetical protein
MGAAQAIKDDIALMRERFPKLTLLNDDGKPPSFAGVLDVCDEAGSWYDSFSVRLNAPAKYPYGIPHIFETGGLIERIADRHVNGDGSCCVAIEHTLLYRAARGLKLYDFMQDFAYPYFANQLYFKAKGRYAASEYAHGFAGVVQFYRETLHTEDPAKAKLLLSAILSNALPARNAPCACGSGKKYKHCHMEAALYLASVGRSRMLHDLAGFESLLAPAVL